MTDREKLIAMMKEGCNKHNPCPGVDCFVCVADHLIANGVVVREKGEWVDDIDENDFLLRKGENDGKTCFNCGTPITKEYCEDFPVVCEHWTQKKPRTNADRIRAMSDEELAKFMADKCLDGEISKLSQIGIIPTLSEKEIIRHKLYMQWLDWLQQPVKDGGDE